MLSLFFSEGFQERASPFHVVTGYNLDLLRYFSDIELINLLRADEKGLTFMIAMIVDFFIAMRVRKTTFRAFFMVAMAVRVRVATLSYPLRVGIKVFHLRFAEFLKTMAVLIKIF